MGTFIGGGITSVNSGSRCRCSLPAPGSWPTPRWGLDQGAALSRSASAGRLTSRRGAPGGASGVGGGPPAISHARRVVPCECRARLRSLAGPPATSRASVSSGGRWNSRQSLEAHLFYRPSISAILFLALTTNTAGPHPRLGLGALGRPAEVCLRDPHSVERLTADWRSCGHGSRGIAPMTRTP